MITSHERNGRRGTLFSGDSGDYDYDLKARITAELRGRGIDGGEVLVTPKNVETWFSTLGQDARNALRDLVLRERKPVKGVFMEITSRGKVAVSVEIGEKNVVIEVPPDTLEKYQEI